MAQKLVGWSKLDDKIVKWAKERGIDAVYAYSIDRAVNEPGKLTLTIGFDTDELEEE